MKSPARRPAAASLSVVAELERRAARAALLAGTAAAAETPLRFAAGLYRAQARAAEALRDAGGWTGAPREDAARLPWLVDAVAQHCAESGPPELAAAARQRRDESADVQTARLLAYWSGGTASSEDYLSRALLRPYLEVLRAQGTALDRAERHGVCPFCGGSPWVAARREGSLLEGARRMLVCGACGLEWMFQRILCPACAEADPGKLPVFRDDRHPALRLEACETCRRYVKSIDLSEDARPIPEVDDLVSLALDLWATEQGFTRIEPGLAGI